MRFEIKVKYKMNGHSLGTKITRKALNSLNILILIKYLDNIMLNCANAINELLLYLLNLYRNEVTIAYNSCTTM